jgi:hypothetical protein
VGGLGESYGANCGNRGPPFFIHGARIDLGQLSRYRAASCGRGLLCVSFHEVVHSVGTTYKSSGQPSESELSIEARRHEAVCALGDLQVGKAGAAQCRPKDQQVRKKSTHYRTR